MHDCKSKKETHQDHRHWMRAAACLGTDELPRAKKSRKPRLDELKIAFLSSKDILAAMGWRRAQKIGETVVAKVERLYNRDDGVSTQAENVAAVHLAASLRGLFPAETTEVARGAY